MTSTAKFCQNDCYNNLQDPATRQNQIILHPSNIKNNDSANEQRCLLPYTSYHEDCHYQCTIWLPSSRAECTSSDIILFWRWSTNGAFSLKRWHDARKHTAISPCYESDARDFQEARSECVFSCFVLNHWEPVVRTRWIGQIFSFSNQFDEY